MEAINHSLKLQELLLDCLKHLLHLHAAAQSRLVGAIAYTCLKPPPPRHASHPPTANTSQNATQSTAQETRLVESLDGLGSQVAQQPLHSSGNCLNNVSNETPLHAQLHRVPIQKRAAVKVRQKGENVQLGIENVENAELQSIPPPQKKPEAKRNNSEKMR